MPRRQDALRVECMDVSKPPILLYCHTASRTASPHCQLFNSRGGSACMYNPPSDVMDVVSGAGACLRVVAARQQVGPQQRLALLLQVTWRAGTSLSTRILGDTTRDAVRNKKGERTPYAYPRF